MKTIPRTFLTTLICAAALTTGVRAESSYEAWRQRFDFSSTVSQGGTAVAVDSRGNVAVTGFSHDPGDGDKRYYTAKYSGTTGELLWSQIFDTGFGGNEATAVVMDSAGNVIVTGGAADNSGTLENYQTVKYAAADGAVQWTRSFNGPNGGLDRGTHIAVDSQDNVIVSGHSIGQNEDIQLLRYSAAGTLNGQFRFTGAQTRVDLPADLAIDSAGFALVTGYTTNTNGDADIYLAKINLTTQAAVWTQIIASPQNLDDEGKGVAVDGSDNVIVTGILAAPDNTHQFHTRKYSAAGALLWQQTFASPDPDFLGPVDVAADRAGNAYVTGTSTVDNTEISIYTAKYKSADGTLDWAKRSPAPDGDDRATAIAVDGAGNPVVTGTSNRKNSADTDYYTVKYSGISGQALWEQRFNGSFSGGGNDDPAGLAIDAQGNVAITGVSTRQHPNQATGLSGFVTFKFGRLLALTGTGVPGAGVAGTRVPNNAKFTSVSAPAIADGGAVAAKVSFAAGATRLSGILLAGNGASTLPAVQGGPAPGVTGGKFKTFSDPVIAPDGNIAFFSTLGGVSLANASGVWTTAFNGTLALALQQGAQAPGLTAGTLIKSVTNLSLRNGRLIALVKLKGTDVTDENAVALLAQTSAATATTLLRTGQTLAVGGKPASEIVKISALNPALGSPGHGRTQADGVAVAKVTLASNDIAVVSVNLGNAAVTPLLFTDLSAASVASGALWKTFGLPAVGTGSANYAVLGTLQKEVGGITNANDTALVFSSNGAAFAPFAVESATAAGAGNASYAGFFDPVVNPAGDVAFLATLKGAGVTAKNNSILTFGTPGALEKVARTGDNATGASGAPGNLKWSALTSIALPGGTNAAPVFLAKLTGAGVTTKNNVGLWSVDSTGLVRRLLRTGDLVGTRKIAAMNLLKALPTVTGATRSFNARGSIAVLATFTNGQRAVLTVGIP